MAIPIDHKMHSIHLDVSAVVRIPLHHPAPHRRMSTAASVSAIHESSSELDTAIARTIRSQGRIRVEILAEVSTGRGSAGGVCMLTAAPGECLAAGAGLIVEASFGWNKDEEWKCPGKYGSEDHCVEVDSIRAQRLAPRLSRSLVELYTPM